MFTEVTIRGSWGNLRVDRTTGVIIEYDDDGRRGWDPEDVGYHDILFILPETLAEGLDPVLDKYGETDILFVGFVDATGLVTLPMQREDDVNGEGLYFDPPLLAAPHHS